MSASSNQANAENGDSVVDTAPISLLQALYRSQYAPGARVYSLCSLKGRA
jgi:hypothetical protein